MKSNGTSESSTPLAATSSMSSATLSSLVTPVILWIFYLCAISERSAVGLVTKFLLIWILFYSTSATRVLANILEIKLCAFSKSLTVTWNLEHPVGPVVQTCLNLFSNLALLSAMSFLCSAICLFSRAILSASSASWAALRAACSLRKAAYWALTEASCSFSLSAIEAFIAAVY